MGCSIHIAVEKRFKGKWVMVQRYEPYPELEATRQCYSRFARLAGVRGGGPEPRGIPEDISESTRMWLDEWGTDAHDGTWFGVDEAMPLFLEDDPKPEKQRWYQDSSENAFAHYFGVDGEHPVGIYRLIIFFDC